MRYPTKDCDCEDFPCCEHADNFPDEGPPEVCEQCTGNHPTWDCDYDPYEEDEDE